MTQPLPTATGPDPLSPRGRAAVNAIWQRAEIRKQRDAFTAEFHELTAQLAECNAQLAERDAQIAEIQEQQAEVRETQLRIVAADEENVRLRAANAEIRTWIAEARTKEINARVTEAIKTYQTKKDLSESSRRALTILCTTARDLFDHEYPSVDPELQHLLVNHTGRGSRDPRGGALPPELPEMSIQDIAAAIARESKIPFDQALDRAQRIVSGGRK